MLGLFRSKKETEVPTSAAVVGVVSQPAPLVPELPALEAVKKDYAKKSLPREPEAIAADISGLQHEIATAEQKHAQFAAQIEGEKQLNRNLAAQATKNLLGMEVLTKQRIEAARDNNESAFNKRIADSNKLRCEDVARLQERIQSLKDEDAVRPIDAKFPRIDMAFLKKLRPGGRYSVPFFAVFTPNSAECSVTVSGEYYNSSRWYECKPKICEQLYDLKEIGDYAQSIARYGDWGRVTLKYTFKDAIPDDIRQVIIESEKEFEQIYVVAEAAWEQSEQVIVLPRDPLVIGFKKGIYWLIASFDTTPSEEYVRREFTEGALTDVVSSTNK